MRPGNIWEKETTTKERKNGSRVLEREAKCKMVHWFLGDMFGCIFLSIGRISGWLQDHETSLCTLPYTSHFLLSLSTYLHIYLFHCPHFLFAIAHSFASFFEKSCFGFPRSWIVTSARRQTVPFFFLLLFFCLLFFPFSPSDLHCLSSGLCFVVIQPLSTPPPVSRPTHSDGVLQAN